MIEIKTQRSRRFNLKPTGGDDTARLQGLMDALGDGDHQKATELSDSVDTVSQVIATSEEDPEGTVLGSRVVDEDEQHEQNDDDAKTQTT